MSATKKEYDYLIVGSGLFGSVFAHEATKRGKKCLILEKRNHSGGNVYCENHNGIQVHKYGAHIFHTNDEYTWNYVNNLTPFNDFIHSPVASYNDKFYNLPLNMNTFQQLWNITDPAEAIKKIEEQSAQEKVISPANLEEQALSMVGRDIYETLIKGYTEKQWGRKATELPAFIIKRLPLRFTFDNNYFNDKYQGIPVDGYNKLIEALLKGIEVKTDIDYLENKEQWNNLADKIVYTGKPDALFNNQFGKLEYRSLRFEHKQFEKENYQQCAVINYTNAAIPHTRTIEHKYFEPKKLDHTIVTWEYPEEHNENNEPLYPINDEKNMQRYKQYRDLCNKEDGIIFGGRLAEFRYYDMHQVIASALKKVEIEFPV
jgi:UDP-galactopyranose mutase